MHTSLEWAGFCLGSYFTIWYYNKIVYSDFRMVHKTQLHLSLNVYSVKKHVR